MVAAGRPALAVAGVAVMVWLAMVPDIDTKLPFLAHRGVTHTLVFAVGVGFACGAGGWVLGTELSRYSSRLLAGFGFFVGVLVVLAHLLSDVLTPMGIAPFWPVSSRRYSLSLVYASNAAANYLLLLLGIGATVAVAWFTGLVE